MQINTGSNIDGSTTPAPEGHDERMMAAFDAAQETAAKGEGTPTSTPENQQAPKTDRPEWLPEKFKSPEDLAKAYSELEKKLGGQQQQQQKPAEGEQKPDEGEQKPSNATEEQARETAEKAGVDFDFYSNKFAEKGALDDEDFKALEDKGFPREYVQDYIDGQLARAELTRLRAFDAIGGQQNFQAMSLWAAQAVGTGELSKAVLEQYNRDVSSNDQSVINAAIQNLYSQYTRVNGSRPNLVNPSAVEPASSDVYRSTAQLTKDMSDPRYATDPAFREDVERKLARSNIF